MINIKKLSAIILAAALVFSLVACNGNKEPETTTAEGTTEEFRTFPPVVELTEETATVTETEPETTEATTTEPATEEPTTEEPTTQAPTTTKKETTTKKPATTKKVTTTKKATAPTSKSDIVKLYNSAASNAASKKPAYNKSTETSLNNLNMGALASIGAVRDAIGDFLGEGKTSSSVKKGNFNGSSLVKSTLKSSDVSSASCKLSDDGKYYDVSITVINETNPKKGSSALGRFTSDFKDVDEVKAGLSDVGASVDSITINTNSVTIKAKIDVEKNRFISLEHSIKMSAELKGIKYSFVKVNKATTDLNTLVRYTDFKY